MALLWTFALASAWCNSFAPLWCRAIAAFLFAMFAWLSTVAIFASTAEWIVRWKSNPEAK